MNTFWKVGWLVTWSIPIVWVKETPRPFVPRPLFVVMMMAPLRPRDP